MEMGSATLKKLLNIRHIVSLESPLLYLIFPWVSERFLRYISLDQAFSYNDIVSCQCFG